MPLARQEREAKFVLCCQFAQSHRQRAPIDADSLITWFDSLEQAESLEPLVRALQS